jgi:hypothetical protein
MEDFRDKLEADDSKFLKFLTNIIPGYGGYRDREMRRVADRLLRDAILDRLKPAERALTAFSGKLNPISEGKLLTAVNAVSKRLEALADRLRFASYGYTGAFAAIKIVPEKLDQLYMFDEAMVTKAEAVSTALGGNPADLQAALDSAGAALDEFEKALDQREKLLTEG